MDATLNRLVEGRAIIERAWAQNTYFAQDGPGRCAVGALMDTKQVGGCTPAHMPMELLSSLVAALPDDVRREAIRLNVFESARVRAISAIVMYNDDPARTQAQILALFDRAIAGRRALVIPRRKATAITAATSDTDLATAGD